MCGGFPLCPEKLARLAHCEEVLIRVRGHSGVVFPVEMLNFPDKPSCYLSVEFTITFSPYLLTGGFISGSDHFWILLGKFYSRIDWAICISPKSESKVKQIIGFLLQDPPLHGSEPGPGYGATWTEYMWASGGSNFPLGNRPSSMTVSFKKWMIEIN